MLRFVWPACMEKKEKVESQIEIKRLVVQHHFAMFHLLFGFIVHSNVYMDNVAPIHIKPIWIQGDFESADLPVWKKVG